MSDLLRHSAEKPRKSRKKLYIVIGIVIVAIAAIGAMIASKKREKPILITTDKAFKTNITQLVTATGKIQPEVEVKIAPEVSGEIVSIPVKEGDLVKKGDLLLKIKPDTYLAQVESQEAALSSARAASVQFRAEVEKARQDWERADRLHQQQLISQADRDAVRTSYDIAKAALDGSLFEIQRAEGALRQIRESLSKTTIYAPSDGTISSLTSRVGERVVGTSQFAGTEVMRIANLGDMEARVNVNENDVINVKVGDTARISVDAYPDAIVKGVVREIASTALTRNAGTQEEVTNFEVKISIPEPEVALRPGMSATADVETATVNDVVAIPIQSVTVRAKDSDLSPEEREKQKADASSRDKTEDNLADVTNEALDRQKARAEKEKLQRVVFVKNGDTVAMKPVETGISDNTFIEIRKGITPGEDVVSGSYTAISRRLKDGAKVEIEKPGKS